MLLLGVSKKAGSVFLRVLPLLMHQLFRNVPAVSRQLLQHGLMQPDVHLGRVSHLVGGTTEFRREFFARGQAAVEPQQLQ